MRVSIKALAPLSFLLPVLALASCATSAVRPAPPSFSTAAPSFSTAAPSFSTAAQRGNYDRGGGPQNTAPPHERGRYNPPKTARATFHFGERELDEAFEPTENPGVFGVSMNSVGENRLGIEGGFQFAYDEEHDLPIGGPGGLGFGDLELSQTEMYIGLRAELTDGPIRPYIGVGGTWITTETRIRTGGFTAREDGDDFGMYAQGGIEFDVTETFFLSINYRQTFDTVYTIEGTDFDGDYRQVTFGLGMSF